ncbi:MAG: OB-fold nucleic acid binding domain-containing protein [Candidatus Methanofastidiosia archaeon]
MVSRKLRIVDLKEGKFERAGFRSFVKTPFGEVYLARILGTVVDSFRTQDESYLSFTIDDGTETIRVKAWREDVERFKEFRVGDMVEVLGRPREYNEELYLSPELFVKVSPNRWILRELELLSEILRLKKLGNWREVEPEKVQKPEISKKEDLERELEEFDLLEEDEIVERVFKILGDSEFSKSEITELSELDDIDVELALRELLDEGRITLENGKYKKVQT